MMGPTDPVTTPGTNATIQMGSTSGSLRGWHGG